MKTLILIVIIFFLNSFNSFADNTYFIDFNKVLNSSKPGSEAQKKLQAKLKLESEKFQKIETDIKKEESDIISQKKILSPEQYQEKIESLRKKVADLQLNKQTSFDSVAKSRNESRETLLKAINPIIQKYMENNNIRVIVDKNSVILGDVKLEITDQIIAIVDKEVAPLKIN